MPKHANTIWIFIKVLANLLLLRPFGSITFDLAIKYHDVDIAVLRKLEKITIKQRKADLDIKFLRNCQLLNVFPKFLCFKLPNVGHTDTIAIRKRLLKSAINKRSKEHRKLSLSRKIN